MVYSKIEKVANKISMGNKPRPFIVFVVIIFLTALMLCSNAQLEAKNPVTDVCLGCLCEATSGCNQTAICNYGACGLFRVTYAYWVDGGKLTLNNESPDSSEAFPNCVNDPYCAANTIQNYMIRYKQDCNDDGEINCYDYAAIHRLGGHGCKGALPPSYYETLNSCLRYHSHY
uniref:lysozyme n=1 Tax=Glossina austeni TaxID=7395 RepID=A0A1A9VX59_GLOAU